MSGFKNLGITPAEFMNTVRAKLPKNYQGQLPIAERGQTSFTGVGEILSQDENFANVWHRTAINLVAKILFRENKIVNPLAEFEGELITTGDKVEEMIIDAAETFMFDPSKAEKKLFERRAPELLAAIHSRKRDVSNLKTLQDTVFTDIFRDETQLNRYVIAVTQSMLSGNEYEKYYETKKLVSTAVYKGSVRTIDMGKALTAKQMQKAILRHSKLMIHPNRFYNMAYANQTNIRGYTGINIQADFTELRMLLPVNTSVDLSVDFFAAAFHSDAVKSNLAIKEVDFFPSIYEYTKDHVVTNEDIAKGFLSDYNFEVGDTVPAGTEASEAAYQDSLTGAQDIELKFDGSRIQAVILDKRALVINPQIPVELSSTANPLGRYTQIILNDKQIMSYSSFMPACVILADELVDTVELTSIAIDNKQLPVDTTGQVNIPYSEETGAAANEVFGEDDSETTEQGKATELVDTDKKSKTTTKRTKKDDSKEE
nr:MAG TPA: Head protein [Caudoviricetes sp.]